MTTPAPLGCPHCGLAQHRANTTCIRCGKPIADPDAPLETPALSHEAWRALGIGFALAAILSIVPWTGILFNPLVTLVHEMGHAATAWLFGYPAIPSFDFSEGGGVTATFDRIPSLLVVPYALLLAGLWKVRHHFPSVISVVCVGLGYTVMAFGRWHSMAMVAMGHGGELVMIAVFMHRAMSGTSLLQADERPAYAMCAFLIWLHDTKFFLSLARNPDTQSWYAEGKSYADNDLTILAADYFNASVARLALIFFLLSLIALLLPRLLYKYEGALAAWRMRALES